MILVDTICIFLHLTWSHIFFSHTFEEVHEKSKFYWALLQTDFLEEYSVKSIFPIHFQLLVLPVCLVYFLVRGSMSLIYSTNQGRDCKPNVERDSYRQFDVDEHHDDEDDDQPNHSPMFVRGQWKYTNTIAIIEHDLSNTYSSQLIKKACSYSGANRFP
jgi:hypothetical protein